MSANKRKYRVGVIGFAHLHINELIARFDAHPQTEWVACADTEPQNLSVIDVEGSRKANLMRALETTGIPRHYLDYRKMVDSEELDICLICSENNRHGEIAENLGSRGIHMIIEKPMASSLEEAERIINAASKGGAKIMINWPTTWRPVFRKVKQILDRGEIGRVWEFKMRNGASLGPLAAGSSHPGNTVISGDVDDHQRSFEWWYSADQGGGALLDYCSYGACLAAWYLDQSPTEVQGFKANIMSHYGTADDNAIIVARFPSAIAILEATWTTFHSGVLTGPVLLGTEGAIVVSGTDVLVFKQRGNSPIGSSVDPPTVVCQGDPLPRGRQTLAEEFLHHLDTGEALHPTLDIPLNLTAMAILDAAIVSAETGRREAVRQTGPLPYKQS